MKPEEIFFLSYEHAKAISNKLIQICKPLVNLNIKTPAYFQCFNSCKVIHSSVYLDWLQFYLKKLHNNKGAFLRKENNHISKDSRYCYLCPTQKTPYLMLVLYNFNIWN